MASNEFWANRIFSEYVRLRQSSDKVLVTYGDLAEMIGRKGEHRLLGASLDIVRAICEQASLPDIATVVVDQQSLRSGEMKPSPKALEKYGGWPGLRAEQGRVLAFDWNAVEPEKVIA